MGDGAEVRRCLISRSRCAFWVGPTEPQRLIYESSWSTRLQCVRGGSPRECHTLWLIVIISRGHASRGRLIGLCPGRCARRLLNGSRSCPSTSSGRVGARATTAQRCWRSLETNESRAGFLNDARRVNGLRCWRLPWRNRRIEEGHEALDLRHEIGNGCLLTQEWLEC
jgi:hypothetical protein